MGEICRRAETEEIYNSKRELTGFSKEIKDLQEHIKSRFKGKSEMGGRVDIQRFLEDIR